MPYSTGTANNWSALLSALRSACVTEGWTLSGDVLHKGRVYVRIWVAPWSEINAALGLGNLYLGTIESLHIRPGTGVDAGGNLLNPAMYIGRIGGHSTNVADAHFDAIPFTFPIEYQLHIHTDPDEVFLIVRHDSDHYQHMCFGHSPLAESTGGTGGWAAATMAPQVFDFVTASPGSPGFVVGPQYMGTQNFSNGASVIQAPAPPCFLGNYQTSASVNNWSLTNMDQRNPGFNNRPRAHAIHHGVDEPGGRWSGGEYYQANVSVTAHPKFARGPSQVDGSTALIRPIATIMRPEFKVSTVAQFEHYRLLRIDHYPAESIVELGGDRWKVYPFMRRTTDGSFPTGNATNKVTHSGYLGWAVRYDGA